MLERMWRKGSPAHHWWESKLFQVLWKTGWRLFKALKIDLPQDPETLHLGIYSKKTKTLILKDMCTPMFKAVLLKIVKIWKQH